MGRLGFPWNKPSEKVPPQSKVRSGDKREKQGKTKGGGKNLATEQKTSPSLGCNCGTKKSPQKKGATKGN